MKDGGEAFIEVPANGEVEAYQGYRAYQDAHDATKENGARNGNGEGAKGGAPAARHELTNAAENYLALHRHAIVRAELFASFSFSRAPPRGRAHDR